MPGGGAVPELSPAPVLSPEAAPSAAASRRGLLVVALGVLVFTPDALAMRLSGLDGFALASLRGFFGGTVLTLGCLAVFGRGLPRAIRGLGRWGVALLALEAATTVLFTLSIMWTSVANAMLAFAATPMLAALMARAFLGERIPPQTAAAIAATAAGLGLVAAGAWGEGALSLTGIAAGFASAFCIASFFVILRRLKAASATPVIGPGWLLGGLLALPFASFGAPEPAQIGWAFVSGGIVMPAAIALISWGSRRLPAAETSMLTLLEVVTGPILVWIVLGENPGPWTFAGGAVVLSALAAHAAWRWRAASPATEQPA
ncbi:DMT family transporter [Albimonas pacifica]|uniref:EamA domain-containing membrane protein RarD n=1 Tax=Albimonas pacifica TaxID=1114924 RepID=A0A1I3JXY8_9RHOB|nr:DMT family transporter [Albimonas pacifica]SFI65036.1 EamA domain-containing membrane protein RarD [Albimonas pacifica]